jgi:hypothetical protein
MKTKSNASLWPIISRQRKFKFYNVMEDFSIDLPTNALIDNTISLKDREAALRRFYIGLNFFCFSENILERNYVPR